jgi:hypothetical protein
LRGFRVGDLRFLVEMSAGDDSPPFSRRVDPAGHIFHVVVLGARLRPLLPFLPFPLARGLHPFIKFKRGGWAYSMDISIYDLSCLSI